MELPRAHKPVPDSPNNIIITGNSCLALELPVHASRERARSLLHGAGLQPPGIIRFEAVEAVYSYYKEPSTVLSPQPPYVR
jgi:hypothetical protein